MQYKTRLDNLMMVAYWIQLWVSSQWDIVAMYQPVDPPNASALTMWPTFCIPPSAMTGTPNPHQHTTHLSLTHKPTSSSPNLLAYSATLYTAVPCGRPTAVTSCVIQMDPLPIPTRSPSTPQSIRFLAWAAVTTTTSQQMRTHKSVTNRLCSYHFLRSLVVQGVISWCNGSSPSGRWNFPEKNPTATNSRHWP